MPTISGPLTVVTEAAAVVTAVWVQARELRPHGEGAILPQRARVTLDAGSTVTFPCAPGPAVLIWQVGSVEGQAPILVSEEPDQTLASVVKAAKLASGRTADELAALVAQVVRDASSASAAAGSASSSAESAASARDTAVAARNAAVDARDEAVSAANSATGAASTSASARDAAVLARNQAEGFKAQAATSAGEAASSAGAASDAADRAENVVDTVQWQGDQLSVMGKVSPPLTGDDGETPHVGANGNWWVGDTDTGVRAQGEKGDPGDGVGDVLWSELTPALDGKANTSHTHTASQISDATTVGRNVLQASSQAAARTAIGAGTSNLTLGTTSSTAARGNHTHTASSIGAAPASHTHSMDQIIVGEFEGDEVTLDVAFTSAFDSIYTEINTAEARIDTRKGVIHSGTGGPPSSIPGAVVGDYWLNEDDMSLYKITSL